MSADRGTEMKSMMYLAKIAAVVGINSINSNSLCVSVRVVLVVDVAGAAYVVSGVYWIVCHNCWLVSICDRIRSSERTIVASTCGVDGLGGLIACQRPRACRWQVCRQHSIESLCRRRCACVQRLDRRQSTLHYIVPSDSQW